MTKLNRLHAAIASIYLTQLCCYMSEEGQDGGGPEAGAGEGGGESQPGNPTTGTEETPVNTESSAENGTAEPENPESGPAATEGGPDEAGPEVNGAGPGTEDLGNPEIQGGTVEIDGQETDISADAIAQAQAGDGTLARKEIEEQERERASILMGASVEQFDAVSVREAVLFLENVLAWKMQKANKHPGSFEKMKLECQEFMQSNSGHPMIDMRGDLEV